MNNDSLNEEEQADLSSIINTYYMKPVVARLEKDYINKYGIIKSLSYAHNLIRDCQEDVEQLLEERKQKGIIKDKSQARKAVVGGIFPKLILLIFLKAKIEGLISKDLYATLKVSNLL